MATEFYSAVATFLRSRTIPLIISVAVIVLAVFLLQYEGPKVKVAGVSGRLERVRFDEDRVTCYVFDGYNAGGVACLRDEGGR